MLFDSTKAEVRIRWIIFASTVLSSTIAWWEKAFSGWARRKRKRAKWGWREDDERETKKEEEEERNYWFEVGEYCWRECGFGGGEEEDVEESKRGLERWKGFKSVGGGESGNLDVGGCAEEGARECVWSGNSRWCCIDPRAGAKVSRRAALLLVRYHSYHPASLNP